MAGIEGPKLKGFLTGDDLWGTVIQEEHPKKNDKGVLMKKYRIIPGEVLVHQYPRLQQPGVLDKYNSLWVEYPTYWIHDDNPSRTNAIVRVLCAFDGNPTTHTKRVEKYTEEINRLQRENEALTISNMDLMEQNRILMGEVKNIIKETIELSKIAKGEFIGGAPDEES